jgi:hypothetical protein
MGATSREVWESFARQADPILRTCVGDLKLRRETIFENDRTRNASPLWETIMQVLGEPAPREPWRTPDVEDPAEHCIGATNSSRESENPFRQTWLRNTSLFGCTDADAKASLPFGGKGIGKDEPASPTAACIGTQVMVPCTFRQS